MNTHRTSVLCDEDIGVESTVIELIKPNNSLIGMAGGGGPDNWLAGMPIGSRFIFRMRQRQNTGMPDVGVQYAEVKAKFKHCTMLYDGLNKPIKYIVHTLDFSTAMVCVEELEAYQEGVANALNADDFVTVPQCDRPN